MIQKLVQSKIKSILKIRNSDSNKGTFGHALLIVGSKGKMGAAVISAKACLRSGVGLLTLDVPSKERAIVQISIPEAMVIDRKNKEIDFTFFSAIGIGSGIGITKNTQDILIQLLEEYKQPLVIDADALNIISSNKKLLKKIPKGTILTPHTKEFDRLFGDHIATEERIKSAVKKAKELNCIIVLKGHKTVITNGTETFQNTTGNAGLAKGGSGDALTGMITAFLASNYTPFESAKLGVYLHGFAADYTLKKQSMESMLITDVIENIGYSFKSCLKSP
ncbi:NAD(P)H-hydrate dehydratase [Flavobacterium luteum]|uniref:ADP-dependent (S)-NAD(P)H-hydrate dehydratase n=1 Tax=Flavobacterium luteum TaxID=2026654 RepID=A0A7J5AJE9_9FLAO|nr:NAD(P)H-hydrate dehydratase [Flavobacterium luteum]KAB1157741.1 NAD(P)H-hydrate dehydratase [Flavobacterium luteum]